MFTVEGRPKVKERPRAGRGGKIYTPGTTTQAELELATSYDGPFFEGPVDLYMNFYPDRTEITIRDYTYDISPLRGDIDNYAKLALDALQGVAFANDRQVMRIMAAKCA